MRQFRRVTTRPTFCVLGAGNGGTAMAAHLALMGFEVRLYSRSEERLAPIRACGGIELVAEPEVSVPTGFAAIPLVTNDIGMACENADVIMAVVPANAHRFLAQQCAPHVRDGQIVVLNPGRTGGALEFRHVLRECGGKANVIIADAQTFLYASRAINPAQARIFRVKNSVPVAALPAYQTPRVVEVLRTAFLQFVPGDNVMKISLDNIGAVFHPSLTVLNAARIEATNGNFEFYLEGVTPSVAEVLEAVDRERVAVAEAMGFRCLTAREWLYVAYDAVGRSLFEAMRANPGYRGIKAPTCINHRYLNEDVPMSLVPIASLAAKFEVPAPSIRSLIHLACLLNRKDYWSEGRTVESLGLADLTLRDVRELLLSAGSPRSSQPPVVALAQDVVSLSNRAQEGRPHAASPLRLAGGE